MTRGALRKLLRELSAREAEKIALLLVHVLELCGDDLTPENVMKQAASLKDVPGDLTLPGITINTSPTDYRVRKQLQMIKFNGERWGCLGRYWRMQVRVKSSYFESNRRPVDCRFFSTRGGHTVAGHEQGEHAAADGRRALPLRQAPRFVERAGAP
jgi:hypothetical protein